MNTKTVVTLVGSDRCGKTQIAKALAKRLALPYYKASAERNSFLNDQDRFINDIRYACPARLDLLKQIDCGIVFDRGYPCQYVYSRFFNRKLDDDAVFWLDEQYAAIGAVIVMTRRKSYVGFSDDLDPSIDENALKKLELLYDEFLQKTKCRVLKLYVDDEDIDREVNDILEFLNSDERESIRGS